MEQRQGKKNEEKENGMRVAEREVEQKEKAVERQKKVVEKKDRGRKGRQIETVEIEHEREVSQINKGEGEKKQRQSK